MRTRLRDEAQKKNKKDKRRAMWAQKSGELHPHPPPTQHNKHKRCTALHLSEDGCRVLHIEWNKTSWRSIFSAKHSFFSEHSITEWLAVLQLKPVPQGQGKSWLEKKMQNQSELTPSPVCGVLWRWRMHRYLQYMKCVRVTRDVISSRNQC